jgi:hypothetical protein
LTLSVVGQLPDNSSMATHDLVITHPQDARRLLGLLPHQASDLAIDVYHPEEAKALCADLSSSLPWPVNITTREQAMSLSLRTISQRAGVRLSGFLPAVLALIALSAAIGVWGHRRQPQNGLFKALGWTNADLIRLQTARCMLVALPALALGYALAYLVLFWPGLRWISALAFDWAANEGPMLNLGAKGTALGFLQAAIGVGLPFFLANAWSGWHSTTSDPGELLQAQPWGE